MLQLEHGVIWNGTFFSPGVYKIVRKDGSYFWVRKGEAVFPVSSGFTLLRGKRR